MPETNSPKIEKERLKHRRIALKAIVIGTGVAVLPELWVKPVVDRILLPAHAATSPTPTTTPEPTTTPCEIAGDFCWNESHTLSIVVGQSGTVDVALNLQGYDLSGTGSVESNNGMFKIEVFGVIEEYQDRVWVAGEVRCDSDTIEGSIILESGQVIDYNAVKSSCR